MVDDSVYTDLVGFLKSDRADLRLAASEAALGVTDRDGMAKLITHGAIAPLCRLSSMSHETCGKYALEALVHLSSNGEGSVQQCIEDILDSKGVSRMVEIALSQKAEVGGSEQDISWRKRVNFALASLVNITRSERGAIELTGFRMPVEAIPSSTRAGAKEIGGDDCDAKTNEEHDAETNLLPSKPTLALLTSRFLSDSYIIDDADGESTSAITTNTTAEEMASRHGDPYQNFAAVLMNATQVEQGRQFVMKLHYPEDKTKITKNPTSILQTVLPQLRSANPLRRRGAAGIVKNCCFDTNSYFYLLQQLNIVPKLLYPLAGPEELDVDDKRGLDPDLWLEGPDKVREKDTVTRLLLVEALLILCAGGRKAREELRLQRVYVILKSVDMVEECEEISERIEECVNFLRRDEEGTVEGSSDTFVEETYGSSSSNSKLLRLPAPSAAEQVGTDCKEDDQYDDVD